MLKATLVESIPANVTKASVPEEAGDVLIGVTSTQNVSPVSHKFARTTPVCRRCGYEPHGNDGLCPQLVQATEALFARLAGAGKAESAIRLRARLRPTAGGERGCRHGRTNERHCGDVAEQ